MHKTELQLLTHRRKKTKQREKQQLKPKGKNTGKLEDTNKEEILISFKEEILLKTQTTALGERKEKEKEKEGKNIELEKTVMRPHKD